MKLNLILTLILISLSSYAQVPDQWNKKLNRTISRTEYKIDPKSQNAKPSKITNIEISYQPSKSATLHGKIDKIRYDFVHPQSGEFVFVDTDQPFTTEPFEKATLNAMERNLSFKHVISLNNDELKSDCKTYWFLSGAVSKNVLDQTDMFFKLENFISTDTVNLENLTFENHTEFLKKENEIQYFKIQSHLIDSSSEKFENLPPNNGTLVANTTITEMVIDSIVEVDQDGRILSIIADSSATKTLSIMDQTQNRKVYEHVELRNFF